jgi:endonuclease VIII
MGETVFFTVLFLAVDDFAIWPKVTAICPIYLTPGLNFANHYKKMPEGPSLVIAKEELQQFIGKKVMAVSGNSKIDQQRMVNKKLLDVKTWGKHLLFCFNGFTIRVHFLMFGKYLVNETKNSRLSLQLKFAKSELNIYTSAVKLIEGPLDSIYDWTADVLNDQWDHKKALKKLRKLDGLNVSDALLAQEIFSGVGNIIKNEVLFRTRIHPYSKIDAIPSRKLSELVKQARIYSFDFLEWKKQFVLKKHWQVHTKRTCPRDGEKIRKEYIGKTARRTFFCDKCQKIYL